MQMAGTSASADSRYVPEGSIHAVSSTSRRSTHTQTSTLLGKRLIRATTLAEAARVRVRVRARVRVRVTTFEQAARARASTVHTLGTYGSGC